MSNSLAGKERAVFSTGVRYMLLATLAFTIMQVLIKDLGNIHVSQIIFFRSGVTALLCIAYLKSKKISMIGKNQKILFLRSLFGVISMTLFFMTIQRIPFGASVSLKYLSPVFAAFFAVAFLKERVKPIQWGFIGLALFGVFLLKGFDSRIDNLSAFFGVAGAFFGGLVYVTIRKIGTSEHPLVIVNYFMLSATILSGLVMIYFWQTPPPTELMKLSVLGIFGYVGQLFMTKSFQIEAASRVAPVKYVEIIYSLLIGFLWFGEIYSLQSMIGLFLILAGVLLNVLVKRSDANA